MGEREEGEEMGGGRVGKRGEREAGGESEKGLKETTASSSAYVCMQAKLVPLSLSLSLPPSLSL